MEKEKPVTYQKNTSLLSSDYNLDKDNDYLHPAWLSSWAYILPISPIPIIPIEAFSLVRTIFGNQLL